VARNDPGRYARTRDLWAHADVGAGGIHREVLRDIVCALGPNRTRSAVVLASAGCGTARKVAWASAGRSSLCLATDGALSRFGRRPYRSDEEIATSTLVIVHPRDRVSPWFDA